MIQKILIITGGPIDENFLKSLIKRERYSLILAADKGLLSADRLKLPVDYILGDFDSVPLDVLSKYEDKSIPIQSFPQKKDKTDTQIAFEMALEKKPSGIDMVGATGSRMDHTISNIDLLIYAMNQNIDARILDANNCIYLRNKSFLIKKEEQYGDFISLLSFSYQVKGLRLYGFMYPLDGITLTAGSSLGISNRLVEDEGRVEFEEGILAVFETKD